MITFSDFVNILYPYLGAGRNRSEFIVDITNLIMEKPCTEKDRQLAYEDKYNPLCHLTPNMREKIFRGDRSLSQKDAQAILKHLDINNFKAYLLLQPKDVINQLGDILCNRNIEMKVDEDGEIEVEITFAELFALILQDCANKDKTRDKRTPEQKALDMPKRCNLPLDAFIQMQRDRKIWGRIDESKYKSNQKKSL